MRVTFLSAFMAAFFVAAASDASNAWSDKGDNELAKFAALMKDAETMLRINADPAQRAIVCRLGFQRFSIGAIARATGLSKSSLMQAARGLMSMGLVSVADVSGEYILLEAASEGAGEKFRGWAYRWCADDAQCEILR